MMDGNTIQEAYANLTYQDAQARLNKRFPQKDDETKSLPKLDDIKARRAFDADNHWQDGKGFIGQLPTGDYAAERTELLKKAFSPEDVVSEVLDTHIQNVLGDEARIDLESEDLSEVELAETLATVKGWFEERNNIGVLSDALRGARRESARVLRAFIPSGMIDGEGKITAGDLEDALSKIWIRSEPIESGGVIVDEETATELGLFLYKMKIGKSDVSLSEYAYLNKLPNEIQTIWGTISAHNSGEGSEQAEPFLLNGKLPIYQINTKPLITNSVCQAQRCVNLSGTMLTRNNNLAGSRERLAIGVQKPGEWKENGTDEQGNKVMEFTPVEMKTGAGVMNFLDAQGIRDEQGNITAYANPNVIFTDPVPIESFVGTSQHWRISIYSRAKMRHLLMADDATASGKSRVEARKEFQASLNESKALVDAAGQWMIETALNIAAHFIGQKGKYLKTKAVFDAQVSTIELTPEERAQIVSEYKEGLIDLQTALELLQYKNVQEIIDRLKPKTDEGDSGLRE